MNRTSNPHVSISTQAAIYKQKHPFPAMQGKNVIGKKELPEEGTSSFKALKNRNEALAEPRNDEKFHKISTMHPCRAAVFAGTPPAIADALKRGAKKGRRK